MRQIQCYKCAKNLGVIRAATLSKGINFLCTECKNSADRKAKTKSDNSDDGDLFGSLFGVFK